MANYAERAVTYKLAGAVGAPGIGTLVRKDQSVNTDFDRVFGLGLDVGRRPAMESRQGAADLLEQRAAARATRDYATSDRLGDKLAAMGEEVRDTPRGQETTRRR